MFYWLVVKSHFNILIFFVCGNNSRNASLMKSTIVFYQKVIFVYKGRFHDLFFFQLLFQVICYLAVVCFNSSLKLGHYQLTTRFLSKSATVNPIHEQLSWSSIHLKSGDLAPASQTMVETSVSCVSGCWRQQQKLFHLWENGKCSIHCHRETRKTADFLL